MHGALSHGEETNMIYIMRLKALEHNPKIFNGTLRICYSLAGW